MKLSDVSVGNNFIYNGQLFTVKEKQKESILVLRISDNHLFNLDRNTDVENGTK